MASPQLKDQEPRSQSQEYATDWVSVRLTAEATVYGLPHTCVPFSAFVALSVELDAALPFPLDSI
jgi:hypothetical protein